MKTKIIFIILVVLSIIPLQNVMADTVVLGWTDEQSASWNKLAESNHHYWRRLTTEADLPGGQRKYFDRGLREGIVYMVTKEPKYAQQAYRRHASRWCGQNYKARTSAENPEWCKENWKGKMTRDGLRENFIRMARLYSWIADALAPQDKENFRDILEHWTQLAMSSQSVHGLRLRDSDEVVGLYFGAVIYALAIQKEHPERTQEILNFAGSKGSPPTKPLGGLVPSASDFNTWRNTIAIFAERSQGGQWLESTNYNLGTVRLLVTGVEAVNSVLEKDYFPEVTSLYDDFANAFVEELTPDMRDVFQWGDEQQPHQLYPYSRGATMSVIGGVTKDPRALYVMDQMVATGENMVEDFYLYLDAISPRQKPFGVTTINASGRGVAMMKTGWTINDSFFSSIFPNNVGVDHSLGTLNHFSLYRKGQWVIDNPRGYYGHWDHDAPYSNTMLVSGGISQARESKGVSAFESGLNYMYHSGLTAGSPVWRNQKNPPEEIIHEWNRELLYLRHDDGSDSVFVFDRLNNLNPYSALSYSPDQFERLPKKNIQERIRAADGLHQWILHANEPVTVVGNTIHWTVPTREEMFLTTFMGNFDVEQYSIKDHVNKGHPYYLQGYNIEKKGVGVRLLPRKKEGFQTMLNVIHVGTVPKLEKLTAHQGERAVGAYIENHDVIVLFNANKNEPLAPTKLKNKRSAHHPERFEKTKALRLFKEGFEVSVKTKRFTKVFVTGLDPRGEWEGTIGTISLPLEVSDQGIAQLTINPGEQTILINNNKNERLRL